MEVTISGNTNRMVYGKGDVCLKLNPFDNYRMFTLYEDWRTDDRKPLDLSGEQKIYLVFKSKNKEIRIPEYTDYPGGYTVDRLNGQVLFKISQKNSVDIMSMDNRVFYITRVHETTDMSGDTVVSSDEEVMYTGMWKDETSNIKEDYTSKIKQLSELLDERNTLISELQKSCAELMKEKMEYLNTIDKLTKTNEELTSRNSELENVLIEYESGNELQGTVLGDGARYVFYSDEVMTEEEMQNRIKEQEKTIQS